MKLQLITLETAVLAREKGFNIPTIHAYINDKLYEDKVYIHYGNDGDFDVEIEEFGRAWNGNSVYTVDGYARSGCKEGVNYFKAYAAPTQELLCKWLREVHNIDVWVWKVKAEGNGYGFHIFNESPDHRYFKTFEQALDVGLQEALKLIEG